MQEASSNCSTSPRRSTTCSRSRSSTPSSTSRTTKLPPSPPSRSNGLARDTSTRAISPLAPVPHENTTAAESSAAVRCPDPRKLLGEIPLRRFLRRRIRRVISLLRMEARDPRPDAVRELLDEDVIVLDRLVVPRPRHRDPILGPGQFVLQPHELVVALQLRIVLLHPHQRQQRDVQPIVCRQLLV